MLDPADAASLRAVLAEIDASDASSRETHARARASVLAILDGRKVSSRPNLDLWPPDPKTIDFSDGTWLRGFKLAELRSGMSKHTLRRRRHKIGVKIGRTWFISLERLNNPAIYMGETAQS